MSSAPARKIRVAASMAAMAMFLSACSTGADSALGESAGAADEVGVAEDVASLEFTASEISGADFEGASLDGVDTVLWFWAPWCSSCRLEAPEVVEAAAEFDGEVEVIGVAGRGQLSEMEGFVDDTGSAGLRHIVDPDGDIWTEFGVIAQPAFAFVNDDGTTDVFVGGLGKRALTERMTELTEN